MTSERLLSHHRLARLSTWARLWLVWFAAFLSFLSEHALLSRDAKHLAAHWLDCVAKLLANVIVIRAAKQKRCPHRSHGGPPRPRRPVSLRAVLGARLRRALYGGDLQARCARLAALARDVSPAVAALLRRLKRGLTRLNPILPRKPACLFVTFARTAPPLCADTS